MTAETVNMADYAAEKVAATESGTAILNDVESAIRTYCVLPSEHAYVAATLWVVYTHAVMSFEFAPRLVVRSALKRSGKSRLLEVVEEMVHKPFPTVNASEAALFRSIDQDDPPTIIIDEADTIFGTKTKAEQNEGIRGLLNAGFRPGRPVIRCTGPLSTPTEFHNFAPAAIGGIGKMPDTIEDRAIVIVMKRRKPDEIVQPFRLGRDTPKLHAIRDRIENWMTKERRGSLAEYSPEFALEDRAADRWSPMIAVADIAESWADEGIPGSWPARARAAAIAMSSDHDADEDESDQMTLIADIREALKVQKGDRITPKSLLTLLRSFDSDQDSPYTNMTPRALAGRLRDHQIVVKSRKLDTGQVGRTWLRTELVDLVERHLNDENLGGGSE